MKGRIRRNAGSLGKPKGSQVSKQKVSQERSEHAYEKKGARLFEMPNTSLSNRMVDIARPKEKGGLSGWLSKKILKYLKKQVSEMILEHLENQLNSSLNSLRKKECAENIANALVDNLDEQFHVEGKKRFRHLRLALKLWKLKKAKEDLLALSLSEVLGLSSERSDNSKSEDLAKCFRAVRDTVHQEKEDIGTLLAFVIEKHAELSLEHANNAVRVFFDALLDSDTNEILKKFLTAFRDENEAFLRNLIYRKVEPNPKEILEAFLNTISTPGFQKDIETLLETFQPFLILAAKLGIPLGIEKEKKKTILKKYVYEAIRKDPESLRVHVKAFDEYLSKPLVGQFLQHKENAENSKLSVNERTIAQKALLQPEMIRLQGEYEKAVEAKQTCEELLQFQKEKQEGFEDHLDIELKALGLKIKEQESLLKLAIHFLDNSQFQRKVVGTLLKDTVFLFLKNRNNPQEGVNAVVAALYNLFVGEEMEPPLNSREALYSQSIMFLANILSDKNSPVSREFGEFLDIQPSPFDFIFSSPLSTKLTYFITTFKNVWTHDEKEISRLAKVLEEVIPDIPKPIKEFLDKKNLIANKMEIFKFALERVCQESEIRSLILASISIKTGLNQTLIDWSINRILNSAFLEKVIELAIDNTYVQG